MAQTAAYFAANHGVAFSTVEAFNEPIANWWKSSGTQVRRGSAEEHHL